jgi:anti-sigma factor RsiW
MMRTSQERGQHPDSVPDRLLWQQCRQIDVPEDEAARLLDLAAFADGLLDAEENERVAALLAADPDAAADVVASRSATGLNRAPAELDRVVTRALAILPEAASPGGRVIPFVPRLRHRFVQHVAQWGSIAAAIAVASWLGFSMGSDASLALSTPRQSSESSLPDLFDPASGFLRDLGEGLRT